MVWCSTESLWQPFPQVHHIHRWGGALWPSRYPASSVAWDQETVNTSPKTLWTLQQCDRHSQRLLWDFMGWHQYWQNQQWTTWVSVEVRRLQKSKFSEYPISGSRIISYTEKHESTRAFQLCCFVHGNRRSFSVNWIILHACQGLKLKSAVLEQVPV